MLTEQKTALTPSKNLMKPASLSVSASAFHDEKDKKPTFTQRGDLLSQAKPHSETFKDNVRRFNSSFIKMMEVHQIQDPGRVLRSLIEWKEVGVDISTQSKQLLDELSKRSVSENSFSVLPHFNNEFFDFLKSVRFELIPKEDSIFMVLSSIFSLFPGYVERLPKSLQDKLFLDFTWVSDFFRDFAFNLFPHEPQADIVIVSDSKSYDEKLEMKDESSLLSRILNIKSIYVPNENLVYCLIRFSFTEDELKAIFAKIPQGYQNSLNDVIRFLPRIPKVPQGFRDVLAKFEKFITRLQDTDQLMVLSFLKLYPIRAIAHVFVRILAKVSIELRSHFQDFYKDLINDYLSEPRRIADEDNDDVMYTQQIFDDQRISRICFNLTDVFPFLPQSTQDSIVNKMKSWAVKSNENNQLAWRLFSSLAGFMKIKDREKFLEPLLRNAKIAEDAYKAYRLCNRLEESICSRMTEYEQKEIVETIRFAQNKHQLQKRETEINYFYALARSGKFLFKSPYCVDFFYYIFNNNRLVFMELMILPRMGLGIKPGLGFNSRHESAVKAREIFSRYLSDYHFFHFLAVNIGGCKFPDTGLSAETNFERHFKMLYEIYFFKTVQRMNEVLNFLSHPVALIEEYWIGPKFNQFSVWSKNYFDPYKEKFPVPIHVMEKPDLKRDSNLPHTFFNRARPKKLKFKLDRRMEVAPSASIQPPPSFALAQCEVKKAPTETVLQSKSIFKQPKSKTRQSLVSRIVYKPLPFINKKIRPFLPSGPNTPGFNQFARKSYQEKMEKTLCLQNRKQHSFHQVSKS